MFFIIEMTASSVNKLMEISYVQVLDLQHGQIYLENLGLPTVSVEKMCGFMRAGLLIFWSPCRFVLFPRYSATVQNVDDLIC